MKHIILVIALLASLSQISSAADQQRMKAGDLITMLFDNVPSYVMIPKGLYMLPPSEDVPQIAHLNSVCRISGTGIGGKTKRTGTPRLMNPEIHIGDVFRNRDSIFLYVQRLNFLDLGAFSCNLPIDPNQEMTIAELQQELRNYDIIVSNPGMTELLRLEAARQK